MTPNFDKWKHLRTNLYQNTEIDVKLVGSTFLFPSEYEHMEVLQNNVSYFGSAISPNRIPGYIARKSYESEPTAEGDIRLTKNLITSEPKPHTVPFEFMTWIFEIDGISKSSLTQMDRHRMASFIQQSGRWMDRAECKFVYDSYYEVDDEALVKQWYAEDEAEVQRCLVEYTARKKRTYVIQKEGVAEIVKYKRQSARRKLTLDFATGTMLAINTLSLRNLLELRMDYKHAEWEIARAAKLMYDKVMTVAPAQFFALKVDP